jgi:hypothetical protein
VIGDVVVMGDVVMGDSGIRLGVQEVIYTLTVYHCNVVSLFLSRKSCSVDSFGCRLGKLDWSLLDQKERKSKEEHKANTQQHGRLERRIHQTHQKEVSVCCSY